jgi:hypothetical protein
MTLEEVRTIKALALLEYQEAKERVETIRRKAEKLAKSFDAVARDLKLNPLALLAKNAASDSEVSEEFAFQLARQLNDAHQKLSEAKMKKNEFGLPD